MGSLEGQSGTGGRFVCKASVRGVEIGVNVDNRE